MDSVSTEVINMVIPCQSDFSIDVKKRLICNSPWDWECKVRKKMPALKMTKQMSLYINRKVKDMFKYRKENEQESLMEKDFTKNMKKSTKLVKCLSELCSSSGEKYPFV